MNYFRTKNSRLPLFWIWIGFLALVMAAGAYAAFLVFTRGLIVTNLTDMVPWGLWITIDLSSIAISAGAFMLCAAVYLLGLKQFQPVARTATFIGLIGYTMALLSLMLDIGRPDRFWHAVVFWNTHSLLWEVTMCVTLYLGVLVLETAPIVGEAPLFKGRFPKISALLSKLHHLSPYLAVVGLFLSSLHQSSLGATYGVIKSKPIWDRPDMSVLFMASAIVAGLSMTVLVSMLAARFSKKIYVEDHLLDKVALFIGWALVVYIYFRFWDAFAMTYTYTPGRTEGLRMLTKGTLWFNFWAGEMIFGAIIPIILLVPARFRKIPVLRMIALAMVVGGVVAYRWDVNMSGQLMMLSYLPSDATLLYTTYRPSLIEFLSGFLVVAFGATAISMGVRYLNIVDHHQHSEEAEIEALPELAPAD